MVFYPLVFIRLTLTAYLKRSFYCFQIAKPVERFSDDGKPTINSLKISWVE